jgi:DNA-binding MarR family transcriptional regulator
MAENEQLIADIMVVQQRLRSLFAADRSDPLFSSHLTLSQLKILMLLSRHGTLSGGELARMLGVGLATSSGMIDRLVVQDLVTRTEDLQDRRVRRNGLETHREHRRRGAGKDARAPQPALSRGAGDRLAGYRPVG